MSCHPNKYDVEKLGVRAEIVPGLAFESERFTDEPSDTPLVKGENVQQGYIDWTIAKRWPANEADRLKKYELRAGDIVLAMDRPWVPSGLKWAYIKPHDPASLLVQRVARLRARDGLDQAYLRCIVSSRNFSGYVEPIVTGVNVPHISGKQIGDFGFPLPPIDAQRKIAAILTAYDDLIEANQRRIALLERMAEEIYREWFVRLRFPGHERTKFTKGVPICWEVVSLDQLYKTSSGGTPSRERSDYYDGEVPWIKTGELQNGFIFRTEESISLSGVENSSAKVFPKDTVLVAMYGATIGQLGILAIEAATNQACCALLPKQSHLGRTFTFYLLRSIKDWFVTVSFGGAQQNISQDVIRRCKVRMPTSELIVKFCEVTEPLYSTVEILSRQIETLTRTRDLLLPRLISGKLRVDDLAIQFPPSMAAVEPS